MLDPWTVRNEDSKKAHTIEIWRRASCLSYRTKSVGKNRYKAR